MPAVITAIEGPIRAKVQMYLKDRDTANVIWREILGHDEDLDFNENGVGISVEDQKLFEQEVFNRAKSKFLPNMKIENNEITSGYEKTTSSRIQTIKDKYKGKKESPNKEIASELVADLIKDPEAFLTRHMQKEDFAMTQGPGAKGFSVIEVDNKGNESRYTYDLTNPSDIERFFRLEIDLGTKAEETKILNEINKIAGVGKYDKFLIKE
jgi:hypothetical protein